MSQDKKTNGGWAGRSFVDRQDDFCVADWKTVQCKSAQPSLPARVARSQYWPTIASIPLEMVHDSRRVDSGLPVLFELVHSLTHSFMDCHHQGKIGISACGEHFTWASMSCRSPNNELILLFVRSLQSFVRCVESLVRSSQKSVCCFPRGERSHNPHALDFSAQMIVLRIRFRSTSIQQSNDDQLDGVFLFVVFHCFV